MAETPVSKFRLSPVALDDLDALAAGRGGVRSAALRDAIRYWRRLVEDAGRENAREFSKDDWSLLANLNDPNIMPHGVEDDREPVAKDWGRHLAAELAGMWEGRIVLPLHRAEVKATEKLAKRVAGIGFARGYALYLCLSHFWGAALGAPGGGEWWHPESWMAPAAKQNE